jgi:hypothetical protein
VVVRRAAVDLRRTNLHAGVALASQMMMMLLSLHTF